MYIDIANLVKVQGGVATREPLPDLLANWITSMTYELLAELTWLGVPEYVGVGWWPVEDRSAPLAQYQSYGDETLTLDPARSVVISTRPVIIWTAEQILAYKASIPRHITKLAFRNRFTLAEKIAFEMAQMDDPAAPHDARVAAAAVRVMEKDLAAGEYVDLNGPNTQAGIKQLETLGVIAAGRADEIIWGDIAQTEGP